MRILFPNCFKGGVFKSTIWPVSPQLGGGEEESEETTRPKSWNMKRNPLGASRGKNPKSVEPKSSYCPKGEPRGPKKKGGRKHILGFQVRKEKRGKPNSWVKPTLRETNLVDLGFFCLGNSQWVQPPWPKSLPFFVQNRLTKSSNPNRIGNNLPN